MNDLEQSKNGGGCQVSGVIGAETPTEPRKPGGQPGNLNQFKHGMRARRAGLVLAGLGKRFAAVYHSVCDLRKAIEAHLRQRHGEPSLWQQARVQTILRLEAGARSLELEIRTKGKDMSTSEVRSNRESIARWSAQRDNLLADLLGEAPSSPFGAIDAAGDEWLEPTVKPPVPRSQAKPTERQAARDPFDEADKRTGSMGE